MISIPRSISHGCWPSQDEQIFKISCAHMAHRNVRTDDVRLSPKLSHLCDQLWRKFGCQFDAIGL